jgi:streptogramin lyase
MLVSFWRKWVSRKQRPALTNRRAKPCVELLEDRCLLTAVIAEFPVTTASSSPMGIVSGSDGNLWFTENGASQIGMINPTTHAIAEFPTLTANSAPVGITAGPDGNLWFTESAANNIGEINPTTHTVTEFALPTAGSQPSAITVGPDGNIWFTEIGANQIGEINPGTNSIKEFLIPTNNSSPTGITAGPDGNLWFTENGASKIGVISPLTHIVTEYSTPSANSQPTGITNGPDGNIWFTETNTNRIVKFNTTTHSFIEIPTATGRSGPSGIVAGADGNLWFTESKVSYIGLINPTTGVITEMGPPTANSSPTSIAIAPGGAIWFSETNANQIGEIVASPSVTVGSVNQTIVAGQNATFTATAAGFPIPSILWEVSTDGGLTYTPVANTGVYSGATTGTLTSTGATTGTLTITGATATMSGYKYEALFSNGIGATATTSPATLTVNSVLSIMPALPQGTVGSNYNQTVSVVGSTSSFTLFSVNTFNAGSTGLQYGEISTNSINGTITINGTPTGAGTASFTVAVANLAGNTLTQTLFITIRPPLSFATASLPPATASFNYQRTITVIGGAMPYTNFAVTNFNAGATGLTPGEFSTLAPAGVIGISGVPTGAGTATFTVNVTDAAGSTLTKNYTITVNPALIITPSLPQGTAGVNYHQILTVTGGGVPYAIVAVNNFNGGTTGMTVGNIAANTAGAISLNGIPTAAGTITFAVNVVDAIGAVLNKTYTITINPALSITPSLPQGTAGAIYYQTVTVFGGSKPFTNFTISGFNAGTTGLTPGAVVLNAGAGTIVINGTPTAAGTATFTVNVTEAVGSSLSKTFTITINPPLVIGNLAATQWTAGKSGFTGSINVGGGTGAIGITTFSGLPSGLTPALNGNVITLTGTPTTAATFASASITIHDLAGATLTKTFSITINAAPNIGNLTATQWTLGKSGFNGVMAIAGGTGGLTIASSTGVPTGLNIVLIGSKIGFTGTPTATTTFAGSVTIRDTLGATFTQTFGITINAPPTLGSLSATQWTAGKSGFPGALAISAGTGPFTIASSSGLPTGLTAVVSGNTIRFTGTPTAPQTFAAASITLQDAAGASVTESFSITINPPLVITTTSLPPSKMALLYTAPVTVTGGTGAISYVLTAGSLPPGMKLSSNGVISGASRGFGAFTFTITATDAIGATFSETYTLSLAFR